MSLYTDADHASGIEDVKSTSGRFLTLEGPDWFWPLRAKAQLLGALVKPRSFLLTQACLVRPDLFDFVLNRRISLVCQQDNASVHGGYSAKLRHLKKVHKLNLSALYELFSDPQVTLQYIKSTDSRSFHKSIGTMQMERRIGTFEHSASMNSPCKA